MALIFGNLSLIGRYPLVTPSAKFTNENSETLRQTLGAILSSCALAHLYVFGA